MHFEFERSRARRGEANMPTLTPQTIRLIQRYQEWYQSLERKEDVQTLHVDEVASAVAKFYEKIRGVVDWREEHLLRKSAIERILRRRFLMEEEPEKMAEPFVLEIIRGGHFPADTIPESRIEDVRRSLGKYFFLLQHAPLSEEKDAISLQDWILSIAACEIEELLSPPSRERALIAYMTDFIAERLEVKGSLPGTTKETQIFIACQQALFKLDPPLISYYLLGRQYQDWMLLSPSSPQLTEIARNIFEIKEKIENELSHPTANRFYALCERLDTPFLLLGDILQKNPLGAEDILAKPPALEEALREAYKLRLMQLRTKIKRAAIYTTLSIFITKVLIALAAEIPIEKWLTGELNTTALAFNITIPPLLMAFLVFTIRPPEQENFQRTLLEIGKIIYGTERKSHYTIRIPQARNAVISAFITLAYLLSFLVSFGIIVKILGKLHFHVVSQAIFLMFLSLIAFAGMKLRQRSKELTVLEQKETILSVIVDFFTFPVVQTGKWLSGQLARYNILIILLSALVEMPLQIFIEFLEQWRYFLKEKKEEIH